MQEHFTLKDAIGGIMDEENMRKAADSTQHGAATAPSALTVQHRAKTRPEASGSNKQQQVPKDECWFCHKNEHRKKEYEGYKRWLQNQQAAGVHTVKVVPHEMCLTTTADGGSD